MIFAIISSVLLSLTPFAVPASVVPNPDQALRLTDPKPEENSVPATKKKLSLDDKVCKKESVTGSFVKSRKVCMTRREWEQLSQNHKQQAEEYIDHGRGGSNGN